MARRSMNEIPDGWHLKCLSEVSHILYSNVDKKSLLRETPVRLCNYLDVYDNLHITSNLDFMEATASRDEILRYAVEPGDVIITKDSETPDDIGIPAVCVESISDLVCGYHLALVKPRNEEVDARFLAGQIAHARIGEYFRLHANGTTRFGLTTSTIEETPLWLPPLSEQRCIAEILDSADEAIRQTERAIAKLREVKKGLLRDLLTRGVDAEGKLRDPEAHPEQFKESPLGKIPRDWTTARLGTCLKVLYRYPSYYGIEYQESGIAEVRGELIRYDGTLASQREAFRYVSSETARQFPKVRVVPGDFVMSVRGTLGKVGIVPPWLEGAVITANLIRMQFYDDRILPAWMRHYLLSRHFQKRLDAKSSGTTIRTIQTDAIESIFVALPSQAEQRRVASALDACDARIRSEEAALDKLRQVKRGLMDDLLTGRVRV